jgi:uncharacterized protein YecT (DUF1311 family)
MISLTVGLLIGVLGVAGGDQCENAASTLELRECLSRELTRIERQLEVTQSALESIVPEREGMLLRRASTAWSLYQELQCEAEVAAVEGGSLAPVVGLQCRLRLAEQRLAELEAVRSARGSH